MKVLKGYVFRLYPNVEQKILINKTIGSARLIYNLFLRDRIDTYNNTKKDKSAYDQNIMIPSLLVKYPFLKEVDSMNLIWNIVLLLILVYLVSDSDNKRRKH